MRLANHLGVALGLGLQRLRSSRGRDGAGSSSVSGTGSAGTEEGGSGDLQSLTRVLEFTVNPLTGTVTTSLVDVL